MITLENITQRIKKRNNSKYTKDKAAVLLPIVNIEGKLALLFQVRSKKLRWQPGDICFPGGRMDDSDLTPEQTAKRETCEELGIPLSEIFILGELPKFIASFGLMIYPFVGQITTLANLKLNTNEVEEVFTVPIEWFINNSPQHSIINLGHKGTDNFPFHLIPNITSEWQKKSDHNILYYSYNNHIIWGLTAQVLNDFINTIR